MVKVVAAPQGPGAYLYEVESDAADIREALREIDDYADTHGLYRWPSTFLRRLIKKDTGKAVFRGVCYVQSEEDKLAIEDNLRKWKAEGDSIPSTNYPIAR